MISTVITLLRDPGALEMARREDGSTLIETTYAVDRIGALAERIPDRAYTVWIRAGMLVMRAFLAFWLLVFAGIALYGLPRLAHTDPTSARSLNGHEMSAAAAMVIQHGSEALSLIPEVALGGTGTAATLTLMGFTIGLITVVAAYLALWAAFLATLVFAIPHEFGHVVAMVKNGSGLEAYGLVLAAGIPIGAFVRAETDYHWGYGCPSEVQRQVAAAGVVNDTLVAGGLAMIGATAYGVLSPALGTVLFVLSGAWLVSAAANSLPFSGLDGGDYLFGLYRGTWLYEKLHVINPERLEF